MPLPTINDIQAVDPVLSRLVLGYMQADNRFVAMRVFPEIPSEKDSGTYYSFTKKYWFLDEMVPREPGGDYKDAGYGVTTVTYATIQYALAHIIPDEHKANNQTGMDLQQAGLRLLAQRSLINKERRWSSDFMTTSVWATDNTTATDWDDFSAGDPVNDILLATRTISDATGVMANTMVLGHVVHNALLNHPDLIDRIKYVNQVDLATMEAALASLFGVSNYWPARASYNTANSGQAFSGAAIIDDDCLVCHVAPSPAPLTPSAGYTFSWLGGGGMGGVNLVRQDTHDRDRLQHKEQWDQATVAIDVGYFFSDIV